MDAQKWQLIDVLPLSNGYKAHTLHSMLEETWRQKQ